MLKMALFDFAINEKMLQCWRRTRHLPSFSSPPQGIWQLKGPHPKEFAIEGKKNANARGSARRGGGAGRRWNSLMHNTNWIVDPFTQVKSAKYMVKPKTKSISNLGAFSNCSKTERSIYNFLKIPAWNWLNRQLFVLLWSVGAERVSKTPEYACVHR